MSPIKPLLIGPFIAAMTIMPSFGATTTQPTGQCLAPTAFLTALSSSGDWIVERSPQHVADTKLTGVIFRHSGMIDVALFRQGCLAMIVVVGEAPPDLLV